MRFETFSFLPPLSPAQIEAQALFALKQHWKPSIEFAESPSSADFYWRQWPIPPQKINSSTGQPEPLTAGHLSQQIEACARRHPYAFVRFSAYSPQQRSVALSFIAKTPQEGQ
jgi:ribulose-bisphosphate carboxylase small chain